MTKQKNTTGELDKKTMIEQVSLVDREKWEQGTKQFSQFLDTVDISFLDDADIGSLQAVFLGEKPAFFSSEHKDKIEDLVPFFRTIGFTVVGAYVFRLEEVQKTIEQHSEDFAELNTQDAISVMQMVNQANIETYNIPRGLVLGFPRSAVINYPKAEAGGKKAWQLRLMIRSKQEWSPENRTQIEAELVDIIYGQNNQGARGFFLKYQQDFAITDTDIENLLIEAYSTSASIYGVAWKDCGGPTEESEKKQERLKFAFEISGILRIIPQKNIASGIIEVRKQVKNLNLSWEQVWRNRPPAS